MKKYYALILLSSVLLFACKNKENKRDELVKQSLKDTANYTNIQWLDTAFDLGTINSGDKKELKFRCINIGSKPLLLGTPRASCGCTVADFYKQEILPGKEGWVVAKFDSRKQCDDVTKNIDVPSNATNEPNKSLTFKAHIINCESNDKIVIPHPVKEENK